LINQRKERRKCNTWRSEGSSSSYRKLYAFLNLLCHQPSSIICPGPRFPWITVFKLYNAVTLSKRGDSKNVKPARWLGRDCKFQCMYQDSELNHSMKNGQWKILRKDRLLYLASSKLPHKLSNRGSRMSCIVHPTHPQQVQFHLAQKKRRTRSSQREVLLLEWQTTGA
jgi:hypothetical protein